VFDTNGGNARGPRPPVLAGIRTLPIDRFRWIVNIALGTGIHWYGAQRSISRHFPDVRIVAARGKTRAMIDRDPTL